MLITWLGHATVLIDLDGLRFLTDPVLGDRIGPLVRTAHGPPGVPEDLGAVLVSHLHADHADLASLRRIAAGTPLIAPAGAGPWLRARGLADVRELEVGEDETLGSVTVTATPAVHDSRRRPLGPRAQPVGFLISGSRSAYFAGDTDLFPELAELRGRVDVALLPVWGWGPRLGPGHLDPERAARAAEVIQPSLAIPIHWGTFSPVWLRRRLRDPEAPARAFARLVGRYAPSVEVRVLAPGGHTAI